jgi:hypothetical protein
MKTNSNVATMTIGNIKSSDAMITKVTMAGSDTFLILSPYRKDSSILQGLPLEAKHAGSYGGDFYFMVPHFGTPLS